MARTSTTPGMVWPDIPKAPDANLLALLFQLDQTQWWPAERMRDAQLLQLRSLLRHAYAQTAFYRERMAACEFDPYDEFGWKDFARLPLLTRAELQGNIDNLDGRNSLVGHGEITAGVSSGSTGRPVKFFSTDVTRLMWRAMTLRDHSWHRRDLSLKLASIGDFAEAATYSNWGNPAASVAFTGPAAAFSIEESCARQVDWLRTQEPGYVLTYPTNLDALLRHCRERGLRIPQLREARTIAETLPTHLRELCREVWGVPLTDIYSSREAGYIALQCPEHAHYHVQAENLVLEIVGDHGETCGPGETGSVVVTVLNNFATPLIRYAIGDLAVPGEPCACGRGLPVLKRVMGRVRNLLTMPDGDKRFPDFGKEFYGELGPVAQFQIVQKARGLLELHVVATRALGADEEAQIKQRLKLRLGREFDVVLVMRDAIPRGPGGKYEEFLSELA